MMILNDGEIPSSWGLHMCERSNSKLLFFSIIRCREQEGKVTNRFYFFFFFFHFLIFWYRKERKASLVMQEIFTWKCSDTINYKTRHAKTSIRVAEQGLPVQRSSLSELFGLQKAEKGAMQVRKGTMSSEVNVCVRVSPRPLLTHLNG